MTTTDTPSVKDRLRSAKLPERTVDLCLRGDLQAEWEDLHRQLADVEAASAKDRRLNGDKRAREIGEQITAIQEQMRTETLVFRMRALSRKRWEALLKQHPPRKDQDADQQLGYNVDTFMVALIRTCTIAPELDDDDWRMLLGDDDVERTRREKAGEPVEDGALTEWQFSQLQNTALALNIRKVDVPNSFAASQLTRAS